MNSKFIKPIPKYIIAKVQKLDKIQCPAQTGVRLYSYLTSLQKELVKITVAVKNYKKKWYCKQVAVHGVNSDRCYVKDMEYGYVGYGFRIGWHAEGLTKHPAWYEDGKWYDADSKYYNPCTTTVNLEYVDKFPEFQYSAYKHLDGRCIIEYLKLYKQYPQTEYLLKLGLLRIADSITVLKRIAKDKKFCKWLIANKDELASTPYYVSTIMLSYKTGKPFKQIQVFEECKKHLIRDSNLKPIKELFKGKDLERFFSYLESQNTTPVIYLDYLKACQYLDLDMSLDKHRYPHNFKYWHDVRIDEYHSAKALADEKQREELFKQFAAVAQKYLELQDCKKGNYIVLIAKSPLELTHEGDLLNHCVGRMNYDQKILREDSLIFFIRNSETPDNPYVTVEYSIKSKKVLQCYGSNNTKPDENVLSYVNKVWLPYANKTIKKITA